MKKDVGQYLVILRFFDESICKVLINPFDWSYWVDSKKDDLKQKSST